ncbi:MAG: hypothetical protein D3923_10225 [Candidatus Electrothrix sp. AR3]|nr:hypothetical protein [Candidatus Electrothrix sp. AR3]
MGSVPISGDGQMSVDTLQPKTAELLRKIFYNQKMAWPAGLSAAIFLKEVSAQGIAPLLFHFLAEKNSDDWPLSLLADLRKITLRQAALELVQEVDLRNLLAAFAEIGVRPLLLKGTPLSHTLYPEIGLRPRCDTDLLIPKSAREKTAALLKRLGYKSLHEAEVEYIDSQMSYSREAAQGCFCCYDIHWQMNNNRQFSQNFFEERLLDNSIPIPSLGENAQTMNMVDALLFSCFHRARHFAHNGGRLIWLYDIHLLSQVLTEQEVVIFFSRAKKLEIVTLCADAIFCAQFWFGTVLPQVLESLLREHAKYEASTLLLKSGRHHGIKNHTLFELKGLPTWRERVLYLLQHAFPPAKYMAWRYNSRTAPFVFPWLYLKRFVEGMYIFLKR